MDHGIAKLNSLPAEEALALMMKACGSRRWAEAMVRARPFASESGLMAGAEHAADDLARGDWLEAFSHHPRIGESATANPKHASTGDLSRREQSGMAGASDAVRTEFVNGNREYERRFGHVFLICATGKSGQEMLDQLRLRLNNTADQELRNAAEQQRQITRLRLRKLLYPEGP